MPSGNEYAKPPILEAIFEVQFSDELSSSGLDRVKKRFESAYPSIKNRQRINVEVNEKGVASQNATLVGFEMTAGNAVDVLLIQNNSLGIIRRAPYPNWDDLIAKAKKSYDQFVKVVGRRQLSRIGSRFINRIDVPNAELAGKDLTEWIKLGIALPEEISKFIGPYSLAANIVVGKNIKALVQSGMGAPALLDHASFHLDIDVYIDGNNIGVHKDSIWAHADDLRDAKNLIFEGSITEKLRAHFK